MMIMKWMTNSRKLLLTGVALAAGFGVAMSAQAQTCTISNWLGTPSGVTDANAGTQGSSNRRYGGPCGLRVPVDGTPHFVVDNSPASESTYVARFYTFLDNAGTNPVLLFAADDGTNDQIQVLYNDPTAGDLTLSVRTSGGAYVDRTFAGVGSGWHSVEFVWEASATAAIAFSVDGATDLTATVDTTGASIVNASLGNIEGAAGGGAIDFDDFDSRRSSRPGELLRGDADGSGGHNAADNTTILLERLGLQFAAGQPDCNEDGAVNAADNTCVLLIRLGLETP
jgi:hypothetical protein